MKLFRWEDVVVILIIGVLLYLALFRQFNQELFIYYPESATIMDISRYSLDPNIPIGRENIALKDANPWLYQVYANQGEINLGLILLAMVIVLFKYKEKLVNKLSNR